MNNRIRITFLILVLIQGLHSVEEYFGRLWEVLPTARLLCSLVSRNHETGFLIINILLFIFGLLCWLTTVKKNYYLFSRGLIWFWIILETINGIGHPVWALYEKAYVPGLTTAPILLIIALYLSRLLQIDSVTNKLRIWKINEAHNIGGRCSTAYKNNNWEFSV